MDPSEYSTTHLVANVAFMLFFTGLGAWFIYRAPEEANRLVRLRKEWGYIVKNEVDEMAKYRSRVIIFYGCIAILGILGSFLYSIELMHRF